MTTSVNYRIRTTNVVLEFYQQRIDFTMYRISEIKLKTDYASFADDVIVMRITASRKRAINFVLEYS